MQVNLVLGQRLRELRENREISQIELARYLNISNTTLSQYETGKRVPSDEIKIKIADYFNVSIDYLLGRTDISEMAGKIYPNTETAMARQKQEFIKNVKRFFLCEKISDKEKEEAFKFMTNLFWESRGERRTSQQKQ